MYRIFGQDSAGGFWADMRVSRDADCRWWADVIDTNAGAATHAELAALWLAVAIGGYVV